MKVAARISETGQLVHAHDDADWALVHPPDGLHRPTLYCPDKVCDNRVSAVERANQLGEITRFFRFVPSGRTCGHAEVSEPAVVRLPPAERVGETPEHRWLKDYVMQVAISLGHSRVSTETVLNPLVRADVFVPGVPYGRVEVQRVATDVPGRTASYSDVVWLLRAAFDQSNTRSLFRQPCVQVRIARQVGPRWVPAEPWQDELQVALVHATSTVLRRRHSVNDGRTDDFFETEKHYPLRAFLRDIWSGRRRWYPDAHRFGGWITQEDFTEYLAWRDERSRRSSSSLGLVTDASVSAVVIPGPVPISPATPSDAPTDSVPLADVREDEEAVETPPYDRPEPGHPALDQSVPELVPAPRWWERLLRRFRGG